MLNTKNKTKRPLPNGRLVSFGVQLDYSCRLKSVPSDGENRVNRVRAVWFFVSCTTRSTMSGKNDPPNAGNDVVQEFNECMILILRSRDFTQLNALRET